MNARWQAATVGLIGTIPLSYILFRWGWGAFGVACVYGVLCNMAGNIIGGGHR